MIGVVVVSHGQLANELLAAAEIILGEEIPNATAVSIGWHDDPNEVQSDIQEAIQGVESGEGTVVLTDMFGGTPSNLSLTFLEKNKVEVVTGVNLPMLIKIVSLRGEGGQSLLDAARLTCEQGKESIYLASDLLTAEPNEDKSKKEDSRG